MTEKETSNTTFINKQILYKGGHALVDRAFSPIKLTTEAYLGKHLITKNNLTQRQRMTKGVAGLTSGISYVMVLYETLTLDTKYIIYIGAASLLSNTSMVLSREKDPKQLVIRKALSALLIGDGNFNKNEYVIIGSPLNTRHAILDETTNS